MRQQDRVEEPHIDAEELVGRIRLKPTRAANFNRLLVVVYPNTISIDKCEASADPATDVKRAPQLQSA